MEVKPVVERRTVTVLMGNEILMGAVKRVLEGRGCEVRTDLESCRKADFAVIGGYFVLLGVVNQVISKNPYLPLVLIDVPHASLNGYGKYFYGIIGLDEISEMNAVEKVGKWFSEGQGKFLIEKKRDKK